MVLNDVIVEQIAIVASHLQSGVTHEPLKRECIAAAIHKILTGECVPERMERTSLHASCVIVLHDGKPQGINSHLGDRKIKDLKPMDVELLLLRLREEGRSDSAISQVRGLLYMMFERAVGNDLVSKNIVHYAPKLRKTAPEEKCSFTEEEVSILMQQLPDTKIGMSIRILLGCGLRTQEILALTPSHIEPDGSRIYIRQAVSMVRGTVSISTPKSYDSFRSVVVPPNIRYCAVALRETEDMYIWQSPTDSKPINPSTFRKYYRDTLEAIPGVRYLSAHACRHTYVSIMHSLGVDTATIQSMVGHSTALMTKHYLHVHSNVQNDAAERFSRAFAAAGVSQQKKSLDQSVQEAADKQNVAKPVEAGNLLCESSRDLVEGR